MTRVLIVDDLPAALAMVRAAVLEAFAQAQCDEADSVAGAIALLADTRFDLALIDLALPDGDGVDLIARVARAQPGCLIVVATIYDDDEHLFRALQAGAQGYLLKDQPRDWLARQLCGLVQGQPPLSPAIARRLLRHFRAETANQAVPVFAPGRAAPVSGPADTAPAPSGSPEAELTIREREVLSLLAQGARSADIATALGISRHTVGDHVKHIYRKLEIGSRAEAALRARRLGLA
jgi:DNA-binding NarL/FixJ family response regulator